MTWSQLRDRGPAPAAARWRARHGPTSRLHRGAYVVGAAVPDLLDRVRVALLVAPRGAVAGYQTAAALLGFGVTATDDIHLVVGVDDPVPQRPGIRVHQSVVPVGEPVLVRGIACTPPIRTALDLARTLPRGDALSTLDAACAAGVGRPDQLDNELKFHSGLRGVRQARELVPLVDARSTCRQESKLRLILHDGGVPGLRPQLPVTGDDGLIVYHLGLGDPGRRIGVEYAGAPDLDRDETRHNWLAEHGWRMHSFTDRDIEERPRDVVRVILAARHR